MQRVAAVASLLTIELWTSAAAVAAEQPNVLWITAEDMSPHLGCYGDSFARTPHLDALAGEAVRYTQAFATAPVCSPARACLITGVYATSLGNPHLRCEMPIPAAIRGFPAYLRAAGYFTSNNVKTDYNLRNEAAFVQDCWDRSAPDAHWRQRRPGQPFFAVFNLMETHQSRTSVWPWEESRAADRLATAGELAGRAGSRAAAAVLSRHPAGPPGNGSLLRLHPGDG
ncbi:MAG: sulfatase-like hydrolase/transferase [Planctomycetes bacterium]|nr:sulfatase-like hydrolase/transferase [Planctomycetota bacterium]